MLKLYYRKKYYDKTFNIDNMHILEYFFINRIGTIFHEYYDKPNIFSIWYYTIRYNDKIYYMYTKNDIIPEHIPLLVSYDEYDNFKNDSSIYEK